MGIASKVREFFWPLLDPPKREEFKPFTTSDLTVEEDDLDKCYDLTLRYYDSENDRKKAIESKSTIFIGTIGFVIAILLSMATGLLLNPKIQLEFLTSFSILMWVIIVIYFCRTVWFSIRALERQEYHTIGHKDFMAGSSNYRKELITELINKTRKNSKTINLKVDNMVMAQEYFKRGIVSIVVYSLVAGIWGLIFKTTWNCYGIMNKVFPTFSANWFPFLNAACLLINIAIFAILCVRARKRNAGEARIEAIKR